MIHETQFWEREIFWLWEREKNKGGGVTAAPCSYLFFFFRFNSSSRREFWLQSISSLSLILIPQCSEFYQFFPSPISTPSPPKCPFLLDFPSVILSMMVLKAQYSCSSWLFPLPHLSGQRVMSKGDEPKWSIALDLWTLENYEKKLA